MSPKPSGKSGSTPRRFTPPATDPFKSFVGITSGTLILECIVILLALPVIWRLGGLQPGLGMLYMVVLAVLMVLGCMWQKKPWAMKFNFALQLLVLLGGIFHWGIFAVGVVFVLVWVCVLYVKRDVEKRIRNGQLYGQEPIDE